MEVVGVIPARYKSSRMPGKPLIKIHGKPLIEWTYRNASRAKLLSRIIVATDDRRIFRTVQQFGAQAIITSPRCRSGTDRVAEVASKVKGDIFVNIQGDEPLIRPSVIDNVIRVLMKKKSFHIVTAAVSLKSLKDLKDPNIVKVVTDHKGSAHYFSRSIIPYPRDIKNMKHALKRRFFLKHLGIYAYKRKFLRKFLGLPASFNEKIEKLEQMRALDGGFKISVVHARFDSIGVDTWHDISRVSRILKKRNIKR